MRHGRPGRNSSVNQGRDGKCQDHAFDVIQREGSLDWVIDTGRDGTGQSQWGFSKSLVAGECKPRGIDAFDCRVTTVSNMSLYTQTWP